MAILHPEKIGIGAFEGGDPYDPPGGVANYYDPQYDAIIFNNAVKDIGFRWYHTWHPPALTGDDGSVRRLTAWWQTGNDTTADKLALMKANGDIIIGTNEPWGQYPLSVADTIAFWPQLMALGNRLASPSYGQIGEDWNDQFMALIASNGYRVDVQNIHYYTTDTNLTRAVADFQSFLTRIHTKYGMPIIITEWAMASFTAPGTNRADHVAGIPSTFSYEQQIAFMQAAVQMMDGLDFIELHSWYAATDDGGYYNSNIMNGDGSITSLGEAFRSIFNSGVVTPPPPPSASYRDVRGTKAGTPGSYFELVFNSLNTGVGASGVGLANLSQPLSLARPGDPNAVMYYANGYAEWPGSGSTHTWASYGVNDIIGVYFKDLTVEFYKNGALAGTASVEPSGSLYPLLSFANNNDSATANFGATDMNFLPAGATSWDGFITSGGRHATVGQTLPPIQQVTGSIGGAVTTLNPNDRSTSVVLSNGNLTANSNSGGGIIRGTNPGTAGQYFEFTFSTIISGSGNPGVGVANLTQSLAGYMGDPNGVGYYSGGYSEWPGSGFDDVFAAFGAGDVLGVYLKASSVEFSKNGTLVGTATTLPSGLLYPAILFTNTGDTGTVNFGATSFAHLPAGATAWNATPSATRTAQVTQTLGALGQVAGTASGGVAGIVLNPADKFTDIVLTNANLTATYTTSRPSGNVEVRGNTPGNYNNYFEVTFSTLVSGTATAGVGIANSSQSLSAGYPGDPNAVVYYKNGYVEWPGSGTGNNFGTFAAGDVLGVFRRVTSVEFYKNGTLVGTATALPSDALYPIISLANNTDAATVNFGASAFSFAPSGALAWGTTGSTVGGFVCSGDSLTGGFVVSGNPTVNPYPTQLASLTGLPTVNLGANGWASYQTDGNYASREGPAYNPSTANVLILETGLNDIYAGNRTVSDIDTSVRSFCAKGRATGYRVYLMTIAKAGMGSDGETLRQAVNTDRRANWASYCDGLIDTDANSVFSDINNSIYYQSDTVHWTTAADTVVANLVKVATLGP